MPNELKTFFKEKPWRAIIDTCLVLSPLILLTPIGLSLGLLVTCFLLSAIALYDLKQQTKPTQRSRIRGPWGQQAAAAAIPGADAPAAPAAQPPLTGQGSRTPKIADDADKKGFKQQALLHAGITDGKFFSREQAAKAEEKYQKHLNAQAESQRRQETAAREIAAIMAARLDEEPPPRPADPTDPADNVSDLFDSTAEKQANSHSFTAAQTLSARPDGQRSALQDLADNFRADVGDTEQHLMGQLRQQDARTAWLKRSQTQQGQRQDILQKLNELKRQAAGITVR